MNNVKCCNYYIWGTSFKYSDEIILQVLVKKLNTITFGFKDILIKSGMGLERISKYTFNKREIPPDVKIGDYLILKINRDSNGNIVPQRILSVLSISENIPSLDYDSMMKVLELKFNPVNSSLFISSNNWVVPGKILINDNGLLVDE